MSAARSDPALDLEQPLRLLIAAGKGGVGKTTCASALACAAAKTRDTLLLSADPAHSVMDCLGDELPPRLEVRELDAKAHLEVFKNEHSAHLRAIATRGTLMDDAEAEALLDLSLPGLDELAACLAIADHLQSSPDRLLVVDTAPTGHALRLLAMPDLLAHWMEAIDALLAKHRFLARTFARMSRAADPVDNFVVWLRGITDRVAQVLRDPLCCRILPICTAEEPVVSETEDLLNAVRRLGLSAPEMILNRHRPSSRSGAASRQRLRSLAEKFNTRVWTLPEAVSEPRGAPALLQLLSTLAPLGAEEPQPEPLPAAPQVIRPLRLNTGPLRLLILGGKGGVGKTSLACALALRLGREATGDVLVFSADPAHSLGDCLGIPLNAVPKRVAGRVHAAEVDAASEFEDLTADLREELSDAASSRGAGLQVEFEGEALARLMDLAPPGIDELMALVAATRWVEKGTFQTLVLDAAPTGHLLRLLEMPALAESWIRFLFSLLLKYREAVRLPKLERTLVDFSRRLKKTRSLLASGSDSALVVVTQPTHLCLEETVDLIAAAARLGLNVPAVVLNRIGRCPSGEIPEADVASRLAPLPVACVAESLAPPVGLDALSAWGREILVR